jgi:hypothetical protein
MVPLIVLFNYAVSLSIAPAKGAQSKREEFTMYSDRAWFKEVAVVLACAGAVHAQAYASTDAMEAEKVVHLSDWATHNGNSRHTGYVPMFTNPADFRLKWIRKLDVVGRLNIAATGDGNAYVSHQVSFRTSHFFALSLSDGSIRWVRDLTDVPNVYAPAFHNGVATVSSGGSGGAALWGFDAATGKQLFRSQIAAQTATYLAPTPFANTLYMNGGVYGGAYAFKSRHGTQAWFTSLEQYDNWTPAVDNDFVYAYTRQLEVLDRHTGAIVKVIEDPGHEWWGSSVGCAPVLGDQGNVLVTNSHRLVSFDLATNSIKWVQPVEAGYNELNQLSLADGAIYYGKGNAVTMRSETDGQLQATWSAPSGATIESTIVLSKNLFFVSTSRGTYAVDRKSMQAYESRIAAHGQLALSREGVLLITSVDGVVTAVDVGGRDGKAGL